MAPVPPTIRTPNETKKADKAKKVKTAGDGKENASKKKAEETQRVLTLREKIEKLEKLGDEDKTQAVVEQIRDFKKYEAESKALAENARVEEERYETEYNRVLEEADYDEVENPDFVRPETNPPEVLVNDELAALLAGLHTKDDIECISLEEVCGLRRTQAVAGYKSGIAKTAIVGDYEVPGHSIYRLRTDVGFDDKVPNIMNWRRGGKTNPLTGEKWRAKHIKKVTAIAIAVPPGYLGNPEELVLPIPPISDDLKAKREKMRRAKMKLPRLPRQPDVQVCIEWLSPISVQTAKGFVEIETSWESRSGCNSIWGKKKVPDFLMRCARFYEVNYRHHGGKHPSEERSISPFSIPSDRTSQDPETETESDTDLDSEEEDMAVQNWKKEKAEKKAKKKADKENAEKDKEKPEKKPEKPEENTKEKPEKKSKAALTAALEDYKTTYCSVRGLSEETWEEGEKNDCINKFQDYWAGKQAVVTV